MTLEEHETQISFDYSQRVVRVYTTREGVKNGILKRLGEQPDVTVEDGDGYWSLILPMSACRAPQLIAKLLNPDEKTQMSDEQKAALRAAA